MIKYIRKKLKDKKHSRPVTGWLEFRGLLMTSDYAAERNYVLTLYEQCEDRIEAAHVLIAYLEGLVTLDELEEEFKTP